MASDVAPTLTPRVTMRRGPGLYPECIWLQAQQRKMGEVWP